MKPELTRARLKELLHYDPETGHFMRRVTVSNAVAGSRAGAIGNRGYVRIRIDDKEHLAHRLAFLYMTGEWPPKDVDHINRDRADNRWENLRHATRQENLRNVGLHRSNTSGHRGVTWNKRRGKWQAFGKRGGRYIFLGCFDVLEEAAATARKWREDNFGEFFSEA